jgi:hypothetical protein
MNKLKTIRGRDRAKVSAYTQNGKYYIEGKGRRPAPRIHRDSAGRLIGIERFPAPTIPVQELKGMEEYLEKEVPKNVRASVAKSLAEHQLPDILKSIEDMTSAAADITPPTVTHTDPSTAAMVAQWLSSPPRPTIPVKSPFG